MTRLPTPGADNGTWGTILNDFLEVSLAPDGGLNPNVVGTSQLQNNSVGTNQIQDNAVTNAQLDTPTQTNLTLAATSVQSINGQTPSGSGAVTLNASQVGGLSTANNLSDVASASSARANLGITPANLGAVSALVPTTVLTASYAANVNDLARFDVSSGPISQTLPNAPADKSLYAAKVINTAGINTLTLTTQGSDVINKAAGATSYTLKLLDQGVLMQYQASGGIWNVLGDDLPLGQLDTRYPQSGAYVAIITPETYGAAGNGTTLDTIAVQAAINAAVAGSAPGRKAVYLANDYLVGHITCTGTLITITGPGRLIQATSGANCLDMSSSTQCVVDGITFVGVGGTVSADNDTGLIAIGASDLKVRNCDFYNWQLWAIWIQNSTDVEISNCNGWNLSNGMCFTGVIRGSWVNCHLRDPQTPDTTFNTGFHLDSTDNNDYPISQDIQIVSCSVTDYVNAQAFLVHAGIRVSITNWVAENCLIGVSLNPYLATDTIEDITVSSGVYFGTSTAGATSTTGNSGVSVNGGSTFHINHVVVSGNTIRNANAVVNALYTGGISVGNTDGLTISHNVITGAYACGIGVQNPCTDLSIINNEIDHVIEVGTSQVGIELASASTGSTGIATNNIIDGGTGIASCIRADAISAYFRLGPNLCLGTFTNAVTNPNNFAAFAVKTSVLTTNPPTSGSTERNNTGFPVSIWIPAYATTPGTAGTAAIAVNNATPASTTTFTQYINGATTAAEPEQIFFVVPPGFFFSVTLTGVILSAGYAQSN